jgi:hypothetical protein
MLAKNVECKNAVFAVSNTEVELPEKLQDITSIDSMKAGATYFVEMTAQPESLLGKIMKADVLHIFPRTLRAAVTLNVKSADAFSAAIDISLASPKHPLDIWTHTKGSMGVLAARQAKCQIAFSYDSAKSSPLSFKVGFFGELMLKDTYYTSVLKLPLDPWVFPGVGGQFELTGSGLKLSLSMSSTNWVLWPDKTHPISIGSFAFGVDINLSKETSEAFTLYFTGTFKASVLGSIMAAMLPRAIH